MSQMYKPGSIEADFEELMDEGLKAIGSSLSERYGKSNTDAGEYNIEPKLNINTLDSKIVYDIGFICNKTGKVEILYKDVDNIEAAVLLSQRIMICNRTVDTGSETPTTKPVLAAILPHIIEDSYAYPYILNLTESSHDYFRARKDI